MERFVKAKSHVLVRSEGSPLQFTLPGAAFLSLVFSSIKINYYLHKNYFKLKIVHAVLPLRAFKI